MTTAAPVEFLSSASLQPMLKSHHHHNIAPEAIQKVNVFLGSFVKIILEGAYAVSGVVGSRTYQQDSGSHKIDVSDVEQSLKRVVPVSFATQLLSSPQSNPKSTFRKPVVPVTSRALQACFSQLHSNVVSMLQDKVVELVKTLVEAMAGYVMTRVCTTVPSFDRQGIIEASIEKVLMKDLNVGKFYSRMDDLVSYSASIYTFALSHPERG
jgi:hypothetical protein